MSDNFAWGGLTVGLIFGGGAGDDEPSYGGSGGKNSVGDDDSGEGQGLFSFWGIGMSLYGGIIGGLGETFGPYITTGPIIGSNLDWGVGAGIHLGQAVGLGVIFPLRQAFTSANKHQDKVGVYMDAAKEMYHSASAYAIDIASSASQGLEAITSMV